jgi:hypothetical protein
MNIIQIVLLFNFIATALSVCHINSKYNMRVIGIKMVLLNRLNKNSYLTLVDNIKTQYKKYHEKSIGIITNIMLEYDKVSDDDKKMLELMISNLL